MLSELPERSVQLAGRFHGQRDVLDEQALVRRVDVPLR
jgi:hypothetical protein